MMFICGRPMTISEDGALLGMYERPRHHSFLGCIGWGGHFGVDTFPTVPLRRFAITSPFLTGKWFPWGETGPMAMWDWDQEIKKE